jgi:hypothetical protein
MSTGWTWDYVGFNVDLPRLATLNAYWKKFPPMHILFAGYVGHKPEAEAAPKSPDPKPATVAKDMNAEMVEMLMSAAPQRAAQKPVAHSHVN